MLAVFQRMTKDILAVLGEDSFLRGTVPCRVNIEHGVQIVGIDGTMVVERDVATINIALLPKVGDTLSGPSGNYKLDALFSDNGYSRRFILINSGAFAYTTPALLRGSTACFINLETGVEMLSPDGQTLIYRNVATLDVALSPAVGDTISIAGLAYLLLSIFANNGVNLRFTLVATEIN